ncbi:beta-hydroxyacyl-ACP dehydratase [Niabella soli]|uniref:3-hydroxyacyl-ACP dehydratase n=1 Tax=Niabella soli DSM 19437 TaxID=929713 RepID=W0EYP1_9BACT|nr:beta-hydroxyacyl-ACP dehydratase [Niabella soli]AHF15897.1 3-hydroxyacyl-ACP dehydratase [Niabella soli DSM 19437]
MLNNNLYTISSFEDQAGAISGTIELNAAHKIFEGHFPGQPVLPGVCMLQIIKELTEKATGKKLFLNDAAQCKFLSMVDPVQTPSLIVAINYQQPDAATITINGTLKNDTATFFKINAQLAITC